MGHHGNAFLSFGGVAPIGEVGGWIELGRTTLGATGDTITVSSLANKRYYVVLSDAIQNAAANINTRRRVGNGSLDTGSNYAFRQSLDGTADTTSVNQTSISPSLSGASAAGTHIFDVAYWVNLSAKEKLMLDWQSNVQAAGAGTSSRRREIVGKWVNTSSVIDTVGIFNDDGGDYATGSEVVVLGWDPADTHTTNFWEVLADVDLSTGESDVIDSGTITAKKYLWVQVYTEGTGGATRNSITFNSDSGSNYSFRASANGGADATTVSQAALFYSSDTTEDTFTNAFIINNSANEKLLTSHVVNNTVDGAGNAPLREEFVGKWVNTVSSITSVQMNNTSAGNYGKDSFLKVWGSD